VKKTLPHVLLTVATVVTIYPVLWALKMAFSPSQGFALSPNPFPSQVTLDNFRDVLSGLFFRQLLNSLLVALAVTVVGVLFACTAAWALSRYRFAGRDASLRAFLLIQMFPGVVTSIPLYVVLDALGLLDHLAALVLVYATTAIPFCIFMLKSAFDALPRELDEAVLLDGGRPRDVFWRVALPLCRPSLAVTALFCFLTAWNEFILAATFLNKPSSWTLPVQLQRYVGDYSVEWGRFAAGAVLVSIPVLVLFFALQRHLVGGLTQGAVKE
jgi:arabinogalactan oligomer/maltooligosaccharide transport system permease protein